MLSFMWESTWNGGQQFLKKKLYNLPNIIGQNINRQTAWMFFQVSEFFQSAQNIWVQMKKFFNLYQMP
jgi:hypothetical protein